MSKFKAPFVVFEGLDGSGKSTLIKALEAELSRLGHSYIQTREPGGTALAEEIRKLLLRTEGEVPAARTELLLYAASRAQHVAQVIEPARAAGRWVLCDRFSASTIAFQCFARGLPKVETQWLNRFAENGCEPDLYVLLDISVAESRRRQGLRDGDRGDRMERENDGFHERVRQGYLSQAREHEKGWLVLDSTHSPETLLTQLLNALRERKWLAY